MKCNESFKLKLSKQQHGATKMISSFSETYCSGNNDIEVNGEEKE